jgi:hypothetical protein
MDDVNLVIVGTEFAQTPEIQSPVLHRTLSHEQHEAKMTDALRVRQRIEDLERPQLDDRSYRIITLPNQLEVLLIHEAGTDKASAALDVNIGSFSDVPDMPGIARAVEHLLFIGTEHYERKPEPYKMKLYSDTVEQEFRISGFINSATPVDALGDAGSNRNVMDEAYVRKHGYNIDHGAASIVRVGQKNVKTIGVVNVSFRFREEAISYPLQFHVLSKCPQNVILGYPFLRLTKTLSNATNFARRVFNQIVTRASQYYDMLYIGDSGPTFTGTIGGRPHEALADTGSKVLIMDENFARSRGLLITDAEEYCIKLRFADGSTARTSGMTRGVKWQFGLANEGKSFPLDFYILKDAPSDVILSENFLLRETQAFTDYSDYLLDGYEEEEYEEEGYIFVIRKETSLQYKGQYNGADQLCNDIAWDKEKDLRRDEDYRISIIQDVITRGAAETAERLRRQQWDNAHIVTQTVQAEPTGTTNQDPPGGASQSPPTAQQSSGGTNQISSHPAAMQGNSNLVPLSSRRDKFLEHFHRKRKQNP